MMVVKNLRPTSNVRMVIIPNINAKTNESDWNTRNKNKKSDN